MEPKGTETVPKIGTGTDDDPIRPDTTHEWWSVISETDTTFTIAYFD